MLLSQNQDIYDLLVAIPSKGWLENNPTPGFTYYTESPDQQGRGSWKRAIVSNHSTCLSTLSWQSVCLQVIKGIPCLHVFVLWLLPSRWLARAVLHVNKIVQVLAFQVLGEDPGLVGLEGELLPRRERPRRSYLDGGGRAEGVHGELHGGPHVGVPDCEPVGAVEVDLVGEYEAARTGLIGRVHQVGHDRRPQGAAFRPAGPNLLQLVSGRQTVRLGAGLGHVGYSDRRSRR
ncbi:hypothetical protein PG985_008498 [Apiospora marii]|uniref:SWIM-type domain-containing protein n=1 Tax=Apiospora marii TaxID=335849 RepID=A0ABR1SS59_9PEZI